MPDDPKDPQTDKDFKEVDKKLKEVFPDGKKPDTPKRP
jgi:hypothetical protein